MAAMTREGCNAAFGAKELDGPRGDADGWGHEPCKDTVNNLVYPLMSFGEVTFVSRRKLPCTSCSVYDEETRTDIYGTGTPRVVFKYTDFAVRKFVMWGGSGDLKTRTTAHDRIRGLF